MNTTKGLGEPLRTIGARAFAKHIGRHTPEAFIRQLPPGENGPAKLAERMNLVSWNMLDDAVDRLLDSPQPSLMEGTTIANPDDVHDALTGYLSLFVSSSVEDSISATLSIPRMRRSQARDIALHPASQAAVRTYAQHSGNDVLGLPGDQFLSPGIYAGNYRLRYSSELGHLATIYDPSEKGCPVARGKGRLIENLYALYAQVTISKVEVRPGETYYYPDTA